MIACLAEVWEPRGIKPLYIRTLVLIYRVFAAKTLLRGKAKDLNALLQKRGGGRMISETHKLNPGSQSPEGIMGHILIA